VSLYWLGLAALAFSISCFGTQRLSRVRSRLYWVDVPNERSLHRRPTPRTGGIAILGAIVIGCLVPVVISWPDGRVANRTDLLWVLVAALMIGVVSLFEDRVGLGLGVRLSVHGLAAVGLVWSTGLTVNQIVVPAVVSIALGGWMATALTVLSIVWMANLYNFMDGIDGFAGGMTVVGFGFLAGVAWKEGHTGVVAASLVIAAAAGGFLVHNLPPAAIFMGDGGSVVVGFLAAALAVMGIHDGLFDMWVPLLVFSPFVVDATITLLRRLLRGERVWQAHREHYYQRLVLAGWGHRRTVLAEYGLMGLCCAAAIVYIKAGEAGKLGVLFACLIMYWALARGVAIVEAHGVNRHERLA